MKLCSLLRISTGFWPLLFIPVLAMPARASDSTAVFNEIMYHPAAEDGAEWIEIASLMAVDMDLSAWRITGGAEFTFPEGTVLPAGGLLVVSTPPSGVPGSLGPLAGRLSNSGELIRLLNVSGRVMDELDYRDGGRWPAGADGSGATLSRRRAGAAESGAEAWTASPQIGGTPGAVNFPDGNAMAPSVRISEIGGSSDAVFKVELINTGNAPASLAGLRFGSFTLPDVTLAPGAFAVFDETQLGFHPADTDRLFLLGPGGGTLLDVVIVRPAGRALSGGRMLTPDAPTFGAANTFRLSGNVVISEIMYHAPPFPSTAETPARSNPEEWIELYNKSAAPVDLSGWQLDDAISHTFPPGAMLAAGDFLVVAKNSAALKAIWPDRVAKITGDFTGSLSNSGERIELLDASGNPVDEARYLPSPWSDGGGSSLELRDLRSDNSQPSAWADSDETAKSTWQTFTMRANATQKFGPVTWKEFRIGMLDAGECLIDDLRVRRDPDGAGTEVIQNGNFEALPAGSKWRFLGNHGRSAVIEEPGNPGNHVLHLTASGPTETNHNHAESTFVGNTALTSGLYEVSFRARWLAGTNQLNTRAYYQKLARTWELPLPAGGGTPGAVNSRAAANAGPVLSLLKHEPPVPAVNDPVTVSVAATDPDGIASATLYYRLNGTPAFSTVPMTLANGTWSGTLPGQVAGAVLHFYIEATDAAGVASFSPPKGPDSRALVQWADTQASSAPAHQLRLIMLNADRDFLLSNLNRLSNDRIPGTLIYRGTEVFHDVGVRLQGTAAGRVRDGDDYIGYDIGLPPDHLFRGVHESIGIDRSARTPAVKRQDEIYVRHTFNRAGIPCTADDLCHFISPNKIHTGTAILQMASYSGLWASSQYEDREGTVFNWDITYDPTSTSGNSESLKLPVPFIHVSTDLADLGPDKEQYRGPFDIRAGKRRDHYAGLIRLAKTMSLPTAQLAVQAPQVLDLDEVFRCTALVNLWGIADTYYTGGLQHNIRLFVPDEGGGAQFLPWDMDFTMSNAATSALMPSGNSLARLITATPANRRLYMGHIKNLCDTVFKSSYLTPWLARYGAVTKQNFSAASAYINNRSAYAKRQFPAAVSYAITTGGGAAFTTADTEAVIEGTGWIDVHEIRRAGSSGAILLTWIDQTHWRAVIALTPGVNVIALEAWDFNNVLISTQTITITNIPGEAAAREFLRITELHCQPAEPSTAVELAAATAGSAFAFVEVKNTGDKSLDAAGVRFTAGADFTVPEGTTLAAGEFAVVVRNRNAFSARYGSSIRILGELSADLFSGGGKTLTMLDKTGAVIQSFTVSSAWFPSTDGAGRSMVIAAENAAAADLNTASAWAISVQQHGNPGAANGPVFASEFTGWRHRNFAAAELADPLLSGPAADPAKTGMSHLLRYAFGLTPQAGGLAMLPSVTASNGEVRMEFRRLKAGLDIENIVETSLDLKNWAVLQTPPVIRQDNSDGTETVSVNIPVDAMQKFVRLRIKIKL